MHLKIGHRILGCFGLIVVIILALQLHHLDNVRRLEEIAFGNIDAEFRTLRLIRNAGNHQREMTIAVERAVVRHLLGKAGVDTGSTAAVQEHWDIVRQRTLADLKALRALAEEQRGVADNDDAARIWVALRDNTDRKLQLLSEVATVVEKLFALVNRDSVQDADPLLTVLDGLREEYSTTADATDELVSNLALSARLEVASIRSRTLQTSIVAAVIAVALGLAVGVMLFRSINRPLLGFMSFVERIGKGDLTQKTGNVGQDELGQLGRVLNGMVDSLRDIATQTRGAAGNLSSATVQLQASAQQQVASTSEQSAAVQQISSTLDEINQLGSQISERAKNVAATAETTSAAGTAGLDAVAESAAAMAAISEQAGAVAQTIVSLTEKTQSVGDIIANVNDIAERCDLLSLNAAIQAAQAGEAGQSFTVVAEEMKNLAGQAKEATVQVRSLLGDIQQGINTSVMQTEEAVKRSEAGQGKIHETQKLIKELVESIEQSVATFEQIVAATNQQQVGIEQVSDAINNISTASQQLTSGTSELEKAASNLAALGGQLQSAVERYAV